MMTITKPKFAEMPKDYASLVAMYPPRPLHDDVDERNVEEIVNALAGHELTPDQEDYFDLLSDLLLKSQSERHPRSRPRRQHRLLCRRRRRVPRRVPRRSCPRLRCPRSRTSSASGRSSTRGPGIATPSASTRSTRRASRGSRRERRRRASSGCGSSPTTWPRRHASSPHTTAFVWRARTHPCPALQTDGGRARARLYHWQRHGFARCSVVSPHATIC